MYNATTSIALLEYLDEAAWGDARIISEKTRDYAQATWRKIQTATYYRMGVPDARVDADGSVILEWNEGEHHLMALIYETGVTEWLYRHHANKINIGDNTWAFETIPEEIMDVVNIFYIPEEER